MKETEMFWEVFLFTLMSIQHPTFLGYQGRSSDLYNGCQCFSPVSAGFLLDTVFSSNLRKLSILQLCIFKGKIFLTSLGIHLEEGNKKKKVIYHKAHPS